MSTTRVSFDLTTRGQRRKARRGHSLPVCKSTGKPQFRDRHQARQAAEATVRGTCGLEARTWACPDCQRFHVDVTHRKSQEIPARPALAPVFLSGVRRYILLDLPNASHGARNAAGVAQVWTDIARTLGITPSDHVVAGSSRFQLARVRNEIHYSHVKWLVASERPEGVARALSSAIDLWSVARDYDELVIVSGCGAFADLAARAARFGLPVRVITTSTATQRSTLSRDLAKAATTRTVLYIAHSDLAHAA